LEPRYNGWMGIDNIDERLERLTRSAETLLAVAAKHDTQIAANSSAINDLRILWNDIAQSIARLVHTAELHDRRLDNHDDRLDNLEGT